ncbi:MAG TPA: class I SAM-dependent methyltransferase [candidate division Zixibacteria bacterium]|nr:class I SAM-dependent methyltransferase [candidate division Zixibacteria bacterium]
MEIYRNPAYYDIAFSFFDVKKQVNTFELIVKEFSKIKVKRFLDVACGPSLQLRELAKRGYEAVGLDSSPQMLRYLSRKAKEEGLRIDTVQADMSNFRLEKKVDFTFIMMGSLVFGSNEDFIDHLDSVACSIKKGGLYFIQNKIVDWTRIAEQSWTMEKDGVVVKTTYSFTFWKDLLNQVYRERGVLEIDDHGQTKKLVSEEDLKLIFPQEFKALVKLQGKFEFVGWWEGNESTWFLDKPLEKAKTLSNINMVLLRKK